MKKLLLISIFFISCTPDKRDYNPRYVVSIGTAAFSVGYGTNKIDTIGNHIEFYNSLEPDTKIMVDKSKVIKIEEYKKQ